MSETQIDDLLNNINSNKLSNEENSMVDAIISDLNGGENSNQQKPLQVNTQSSMPQITPEEKELLMKQQYMEQQRIMQQQMQQQQMQQQQMQQMQPQQQKNMEQGQTANIDTNNIKSLLMGFKETIIVLFLTFLFNFDVINETLKFKSVSFLFNSETSRPTIIAVLIKSVVIAVLFYIIQQFLK